MKKIMFLFIFIAFSLMAQSARYLSMGNSGIAVQGAESLFCNPAGIGFDRSAQYVLMYSFNNKYGISGYYVNTGGILLPTYKVGDYFLYSGLGVENTILQDMFMRNDVFFALSIIFGNAITMGIKGHYDMLDFADGQFEGKKIFYAEAGILYIPLSSLHFGITFNSLNYSEEKPWENLKLGISYLLDRFNVILNADMQVLPSIHYNDGYRVILNSGIEKMLTNGLYFRVGVENLRITLGLGLEYRKFVLDYAYSSTLSGNQEISMKYNF